MGFFSDLFGGGSRKDIRRGAERARTEIGTAYESGRGIIEQYSGSAKKFLEPQIASGNKARAAYERSIGLDGPDAQREAMDEYQTSPGFEAKLEAGNRNIESRLNARGGLYSGRALKELRDYGHGMLSDDFNNTMNRYERLSTGGSDAARSMADMEFRTGSELASSHFGEGGMRANVALNEAEQMANSRFTLGDLAGLIGGAAKVIASI